MRGSRQWEDATYTLPHMLYVAHRRVHLSILPGQIDIDVDLVDGSGSQSIATAYKTVTGKTMARRRPGWSASAVFGATTFLISHHLLSSMSVAAIQSPLICEDTISGFPPFHGADTPCLLECGTPLPIATGGLLPGSVNTTAIPYCELDCVHTDATPAQSSAAPACNQQCRQANSGTPEQLGWCMYWCVQGGSIASLVVSTTCVPSLQLSPVLTSTVNSDLTVTIKGRY